MKILIPSDKLNIDKKTLKEETLKSIKQGQLTDKFCRMYMKMAYSFYRNVMYINSYDVDDYVQHSTLDVIKYIHNYDPKKDIFNYLTQIIKRSASDTQIILDYSLGGKWYRKNDLSKFKTIRLIQEDNDVD